VSLWSDPAASPFGDARRAPEHLDAVERVKDWTRTRFALADASTIVVTEVSRALPGWPETETVVGFWDAELRHHFRVFKRVEDVVEDDLPPPWLKASLTASDGIQCACC
jgi:nitrate reductase delta subunit